MPDKRYNLTVDLSGSEELNKEIDEMIRARVVNTTRQVIDDEVREIIASRVTDDFVDKTIRSCIRDRLNHFFFGNDLYRMFAGHPDLLRPLLEKSENAVRAVVNDKISKEIKDCVAAKLGSEVNTIKSVVKVMSAITEDENGSN